MADWESKLTKELETIIRVNVSQLSKIIFNLNKESRQKWIDTFKEKINETCVLLVEEASFFVSVQYLQEKSLILCNRLQIDILPYNSEKLTLYEERRFLEKRVKEYEDEIISRHKKLKELNSDQIALCKLLEKIPMVFIEKTIPTEDELKYLSLEVEKLKKEYDELTDQFYKIQQNIKSILHNLDLEIPNEINETISSIENRSLRINKEIVRTFTGYFEELQQKQNKQECEQLESLRQVIDKLYDSCHVAESERKFRTNIQQTSLNGMQSEISTLKTYWNNNKKQLSLITKYKQQWKKLAEFMQNFHKTSDSDKPTEPVFILCKQLYKLERLLIDSTIEYEQQNKKSFTTFGLTIPDVICQLHATYGKCSISDENIIKRLTDIITEYSVEPVNSSTNVINSSNQNHFEQRKCENRNVKADNPTNRIIKTRNTSKITRMNRTDGNLLSQNEVPSFPSKKGIITDDPKPSSSSEDLTMYSDVCRENVNINMKRKVQ